MVRPARAFGNSPASPRELGERSPLRLAAARGALALELYEPIELGPLSVSELVVSLPGLNFPVDLSGGVPAFRHRRGVLERGELTLAFADLVRWARRGLAAAFGDGEQAAQLTEVRLWGVPGGLAVGLHSGTQALAFELLWAPAEGDVDLVVSAERGAGLGEPALGRALRALDSCLGRLGERSGRRYRLGQLATALTRRLLPALGARAPEARGVRFGELVLGADELLLRFDRRQPPLQYSPRVARALELAELTREADDRLAAGDAAAARQLYLTALGEAPRHLEIARQIAELDVWTDDRREAALGLLVECGPVAAAGVVGVELLAHSGDLHGAQAAAEALASAEVFAPLAALGWLEVAELARAGAAELGAPAGAVEHALERAVAVAPALEAARWARVEHRLERGELTGALGDLEQLEAIQTVVSGRHAVCLRAGQRLLQAGYLQHAGRWFERAVRYCPEDAEATWGLARALSSAGRGARAVALLGRAIELGERAARVPSGALIDLAQILAEMGDVPAAIARLRAVTGGDADALRARALEGRLRARLGDLAGASQAYGRLRAALQALTSHDAQPSFAAGGAAWLAEAARFERERLGDWHAAERHLAVALRLAPHDAEIAAAYRTAAEEVARSRAGLPDGAPLTDASRETRLVALDDASSPSSFGIDLPERAARSVPPPWRATRTAARPEGAVVPPASPRSAEPSVAPERAESERATIPWGTEQTADVLDSEEDSGEAALHEAAERLRRRLEADPEDDNVALELALSLERLGADLELYALLSARLEDSDAPLPELAALLRGVLVRLRDGALARGAQEEAWLYAAALARVVG
ncbi:MAG: hypothetical protein KF915_06095 [Polyangiaceae bacterium]|nr:hypothetical protein [Polyangiaceae bacterium]